MLTKLKSEYEKEPDSIETNRAIAEYYVSNDMLEEAEPYLIKMLDIDEEIASAHNQLGAICFKRSQYSDAEYHFKKALQVDFNSTEAHFNMAFLYQTQSKFSEALSHYKEVLVVCQDDPEVYHFMGQCAQAVEMLMEAEAFFAESFRLAPIAESAVDLSMLYIAQEKYMEAEDVLTFLIDLTDNETEKQRPEAHTRVQPPAINLDQASLNLTLGLVLAKQGKYMDAIKHLRNAVMIDDHNEQAYNYLGECCAAIGLNKEAESFFAKASKLDPQYIQPIANLGTLHYDQKEYHKAIIAIEQYIKVDDQLIEAQDQKITETLDTETELLYKLLGRSYLQIGNKEKASEIWKESLKRNPNQPEIMALINDLPDTVDKTVYKRISLSIDGPPKEIYEVSSEKQTLNTEAVSDFNNAGPGPRLVKDLSQGTPPQGQPRKAVTIKSIAQLDQLMITLNPQGRENLALELQEVQTRDFLRRSGYAPADNEPNSQPIDDRTFFVTGTGRCGTMFLANLLNKNPEVQVYHEPLQFGDRVASPCAYGSESFSHTYIEKRREFIEGHFKRGGIRYYGEINAGLGFHIAALKGVFNAPVYILVRDGRDVVRSLYSRNHFRGDHISDLIRPKEDSPYFHEWENFSRFEKLCWFWASLNETYLNGTEDVIRFEDIISDWEIVNRIFNVDIPLNVPKELWLNSISSKTNATPKYQLPPYENWSDEQRELFDKHCRKMMIRFGYEY